MTSHERKIEKKNTLFATSFMYIGEHPNTTLTQQMNYKSKRKFSRKQKNRKYFQIFISTYSIRPDDIIPILLINISICPLQEMKNNKK